MLTALLVLTLLYLAFQILVMFPPPPLTSALAHRFPAVIFSVPAGDRIVALTIDDGPSASTGRILDVLREHDAHATFFVMGSRVPGNEELLERAVEEGNELGNHLMVDRPSILLRPGTFRKRLLVADSLIAPHYEATLLRPASGWFTAGMISIAREEGYRICLGSAYAHDTKIRNVSLISRYLEARATSGGILILHEGDSRGYVVEVLRRVLPALQSRGYRVVTVSELLGNASAPG